ncbi:hypothetical protein [Salinibacter altiplanensis]|uniref:hypothetical protein n=1 Tax=Salinibacter altiplanensis TaxID=1803181 RepID=UPI00131A51F2|nr:hypothetical protein [Salinibacter altiplanensis]
MVHRSTAWIFVLLVSVLLVGLPGESRAQETSESSFTPSTDINGYVFGDYYWMAGHHDSDIEGQNGFSIRRIYLTFDYSVAPNWSVRVRGEMNQPGDFTSGDKMTPVVKDAYVRWNSETGRHSVSLGIAPTPTWGVVEDVWGYRSVEKTALDLYKFGSSRDFGVSAQGELDSDGLFQYHAMFANGNSNGTEFNKGKKGMLALTLDHPSGVIAQVYGDLENGTDDGGRTTVQGALFYEADRGRIGLQYAHQTRFRAGNDAEFDIVSMFGAASITSRVDAFLRYDRQFQPNPQGPDIDYLPIARTAEANYAVGGLDIAIRENIHFMPNIEAVFYSNPEPGVDTPDTDLVPRATFYYRFGE